MDNTLHFTITVDGNGLKDIQTQSQSAFNGIKKGVDDLSKHSVSQLQSISVEAMYAVDKFNQLAKAVGIDPKFLRQTLSYLRELQAEQEKLTNAQLSKQERIANAEAKLIRQQIANLEAERRAKERQTAAEIAAENKLAAIKQQNIAYIGKLRHDEHTKFINDINAQNKKIKEQADKMLAEMNKVFGNNKGFGSNFMSGAKGVLTGANNGIFSNILGGFGGGGRIGGTIASALDGAMSGGGGAALAGGLLAGAGIGAAIAALQTLVSVIKAAASAFYDFAKSAVQSAADFEMTVNSIAVFSGSVSTAKEELTKLEEVVQKTPGLSLDGAEKGYRQLRALGFEADNARKLIEGLGKIKITSGATDQSVERVIVNLTQLSASTARAGQDIKEIIHAIPAMRAVFKDAFGSAEASKIKQAIEKDGEAAFKKIADAMERAKGASGGMNSALTQLYNAWEIVSREFGKPVVPVVTAAIKELTAWIMQNKDGFYVWGTIIADVVSALTKLPSVIASITAQLVGLPYVDLFNFGSNLNTMGEYERRLNALIEKRKSLSGLPKDQQEFFLGLNNVESFEEQLRTFIDGKANEQYVIEQRNQEKIAAMKEKKRLEDIQNLEDSYSVQKLMTENFYSVEEAKINASKTYTLQDELEKTKQLGGIRKENLQSQLLNAVAYYDETIKLQIGNDTEVKKLLSKRKEETLKLQAQIQIAEINSQKEIADAEEKILEARKAAQIEYGSILVDNAKFSYDQVTREVTRQLASQTISVADGYNKMRDAATNYFDQLRNSTLEKYRLQLQDKRLSDEQRINLELRMNADILKINADRDNTLLEMDERRWQESERLMRESVERSKSYMDSLQGVYGSLGSLLTPETFTSSTAGTVNKVLGVGAVDAQVRELESKLPKLVEAKKKASEELLKYNDFVNMTTEQRGVYQNLSTAETNAGNELQKLNDQITKLKDSIPDAYRQIVTLAEGIDGGTSSFDAIAKKLLEINQIFERASLSADINMYKSLLELEKKKPTERIDANDFRALQDPSKIIAYSSALSKLTNEEKTLGIKQQAEAIELYNNSVDGLKDRLGKLQSGDKSTLAGVIDGVSKDILKERIGLIEENIALEAQIATVGDNSATRYRNAWLRAIYDVKEASIQARESQIESQVKIAEQTEFNADRARASILENMAGAKGYTEVFADAFIAINDKIGDGLSKMIGKATESLGAFGDIIADIATNLLKMVTNRLMMKLVDALLPIGNAGGGSGGSSGFSLSGIGSTVLGILTGGFNRGGSGGNNSAVSGGGTANTSAAQALINTVLPTFARGGSIASASGFGAADAFTSASSITNSDLLSRNPAQSLMDAWRNNVPSQVSTNGQMPTDLAGNAIGGLFGGNFSLANLGKGLGAMAPMLGMSLGASLGGQSIFGQILGGGGGLLAGGVLSALTAGSLTGATTGGIFGSIGGLLGISAGATAGIALAAAPLIMIGSYLLGRNKQRREDEKLRTSYLQDAFTNLDEILTKVKAHQMDGGEAISQAEAIREQYRQQATSLKSDKTRRIALKEIGDRINPRIEAIRAAAKIADEDKARFEDRLPEFATGGIVPGRFGEPRLVLAHGGEIIANPSQQTPAFLAAAADAGVPGIKGNSGSNSNQGGNIHVEFVIGTDAQNQLFVNGQKSTKGYNLTLETQKKAKAFRDVSF